MFLSQQMEPITFSSFQEGWLRRNANHWSASNSEQQEEQSGAAWKGRPKWTPGERVEHSHSGSGVRKLRVSTHSKILMNFSEISQVVLRKFTIPATLNVTAGVRVSVLSLTLLLFRELNAVQGLEMWRKPFLPPSCSSHVPGLPQRGFGLGFCSSTQVG